MTNLSLLKQTHFHFYLFSAVMLGRGEFGEGDIYGRSSSTNSMNCSLGILKFFFHSSETHFLFIMFCHHLSLRPGLTQNRLRWGIFLRRDNISAFLAVELTFAIAKIKLFFFFNLTFCINKSLAYAFK